MSTKLKGAQTAIFFRNKVKHVYQPVQNTSCITKHFIRHTKPIFFPMRNVRGQNQTGTYLCDLDKLIMVIMTIEEWLLAEYLHHSIQLTEFRRQTYYQYNSTLDIQTLT